ncbi:hypothetical protein CHLRE_02g115226v5 [Chlamydomonas reinhardtii]|uniref:Uncharacterized protein n=1 Tax=Chlamydomonas reinhardtii TaxID=3055 RepID=A0A2K3E394_CHLRE|nr:uncharacterized protein CHLRE_02g115226v5 [Chlamydomonas reinhardtii]PNW87254.1 hypothetical protein CHLRE_02g115226v5 [Chlamydomonas reinhardtii]
MVAVRAAAARHDAGVRRVRKRVRELGRAADTGHLSCTPEAGPSWGPRTCRSSTLL